MLDNLKFVPNVEPSSSERIKRVESSVCSLVEDKRGCQVKLLKLFLNVLKTDIHDRAPNKVEVDETLGVEVFEKIYDSHLKLGETSSTSFSSKKNGKS